MHKMLKIGAILFAIVSCKPVTIKEPVITYSINTEFFEACVARKNFDIRSEPDTVGEFVEEVQFIPLDTAPKNMMCFTMENWLTLIKPKLKEGAQQYKDNR